MSEKTLAEMLDEADAKAKQGTIYPACGGTEVPLLDVFGNRWLYVWQPSSSRHGWLNLGTDIVEWDPNFSPSFHSNRTV